MSGESYNYADKKGGKHDNLDVIPPGVLDYKMRKEIKKGWANPSDGKDYIWGKVDNKEDGYSKKEESIENIFEKYFK